MTNSLVSSRLEKLLATYRELSDGDVEGMTSSFASSGEMLLTCGMAFVALLAAASIVRSLARDGRLRVAHVNANFTAGSGGITLREAAALDRERYDSTILAPEGAALFERAEEAGLSVIRLRNMVGGRDVHPRGEVEAFRELSSHLAAGDFDLVHTHGSRAGTLRRVAAKRVGAHAIVHTLHGFPFNEFQSRLTRSVLQTIERRLGRLTDYFLADGTFVASEAVRLKIAPPDRVRALISSIDPVPRSTPATRQEARRVLGLPSRAKVVGTAARLASQKAPLDLVRAIALLDRQDVYVVWLGDGPLRRQTERLIEEKRLGDRFLLVGDRQDVPRLLPAFDVFALSSLWEGLPCSVVEAMTCGIPVVASAVNSVSEIVVAGKTGLVTRPADPSSLAQGIAYLLDHPDEAARMAAAARVRIGEQFRAEDVGSELMQAYDTALRLGRARLAAPATA